MDDKPQHFFLMICSSSTEKECLDKLLFGTVKERAELVKDVKIGDLGLLFNYKTRELIGVFRAVTEYTGVPLDPSAWAPRSYPVQFRVERIGETQRLANGLDILHRVDAKVIASRPVHSTEAPPDGIQIPQEALYPMDGEGVTGEKILLLFRMGLETAAEILSRGRLAAVAAIMGRNMSHNIGSHVLARMSEPVVELRKGEDIKALFKYLQERMDFIAQVSTSMPSWAVDLPWQEIVGYFEGQALLLDNIASFKGLGKSNIQIKYNPDSLCYVSVPNGLVGRHAFFSVMENIIRNSARYGCASGNLVIDISITDHDQDFWRIAIRDSWSRVTADLLDKLNAMLAEPLVESDGRVKSNYWGMKEIKISSAYLRLIGPEKVDKEYEANISGTAPVVGVVERGGGLAFELFLLKPKQALIVCAEMPARGQTGIWRKQGIDFTADLEPLIEQGSVNHKFLAFLWDKGFERGRALPILPDSLQRLPLRIVDINVDDLAEPEQLLETLWCRWLCETNPEYLDRPVIVRGIGSERLRKKLSLAGLEPLSDTDDPWVPGAIVFDHNNLRISELTMLDGSACFHVPFSAGGTFSSLLESDAERLSILKYELRESAAINVAILDSRIWEQGRREIDLPKTRTPLSLADFWARLGVDIIDHAKVIEDFGGFVEGITSNYHFMIVHQGELDETRKHDGDFDAHWSLLRKKVGNIVIDTGRGLPDQAKQQRLRWIQYSLLQNIVVDQARELTSVATAKYNLVQLLFSLRAE